MRRTKKKSIKNKKRERKTRIKHKIKTRKNIGGSQEVYLTIQPSALGIRGESEWEKIGEEKRKTTTKPVFSKLLSKVSIVNSPSIDIDEKIAEIVESIENSAKLVTPIHSKMMTSKIINRDEERKNPEYSVKTKPKPVA